MAENRELDLRGLHGGLAAIRLREALRWMKQGEGLSVIWDDPQVARELELFCLRSGDELQAVETGQGDHSAKIIRTSLAPRHKEPEDSELGD